MKVGLNFNGSETGSSIDTTALWTHFGSASGSPTALSLGDLPALSQQLDSNRLAGVSVKWMPGLPNGASLTSYSPMTITYDRDGIEGNVETTALSNQLEQVNSVSVKNLYRPWKRYIKAPKYKIATRIPSHTYDTDLDGYSPNENLAGQWKRVGSNLTSAWTDTGAAISRGTHLLCFAEFPPGAETNQLVGTFIFTSYYVYKDRR